MEEKRKIISHIASKQILIYLYHKTENEIISVNWNISPFINPGYDMLMLLDLQPM